MSTSARLGWWIALACHGLAGAGLAAGEPAVRFTRIVAPGDGVPGAPPGTRFNFTSDPQLGGQDGSLIAFLGASADVPGLAGVYVVEVGGAISRVLDPEILASLPGTPAGSELGELRQFDIDETGLVGMWVEGLPPETPDDPIPESYTAVLGWRDGLSFPIAWRGQPVPGGPPGATFSGVGLPHPFGGAMYFPGWWGGSETPVLYRWRDGVVEPLDTGDLHIFRFSPGPAGLVLIAADPNDTGWPYGIWRWTDDAPPEEVFDFGMPPPGAPAGSVWTSSSVYDGLLDDAVGLIGGTLGYGGYYRVWQESAELIFADGGIDPVTGLALDIPSREFSADGQRFAFESRNAADFLGRIRLQEADRSIRKVLDVGDTLDGETVSFIDLRYHALRGNLLALGISRQTDSSIWLVDLDPQPVGPATDIPVGPGALVLFAVAVALLGAWRLRSA